MTTGSSPRARVVERIDAFFRSRLDRDAGSTEITLLLFRIHHVMMRTRTEAARAHDLTIGALVTLFILRACHCDEPITPSDLGEATMMTSGGVSKVLQMIEQRGLVARTPHPSDARSSRIVLSDAGLALVDEILPAVEQRDREALLAGLTSEEVAEFTRLLGKVSGAARLS